MILHLFHFVHPDLVTFYKKPGYIPIISIQYHRIPAPSPKEKGAAFCIFDEKAAPPHGFARRQYEQPQKPPLGIGQTGGGYSGRLGHGGGQGGLRPSISWRLRIVCTQMRRHTLNVQAEQKQACKSCT